MRLRSSQLAAAVFFILLAVYTLTISGRFYSVDGMAMYQQAKTLLYHHTLEFRPPFHWIDYEAAFTYWPIGLTLVYLAPLGFFGSVVFPGDASFRTVPADALLLATDPSFIYVSITIRIVTALTASLVYLTAVRLRCPRGTALLMAGVYALASPALVYQKLDFAQPLAGLLLMLAVWFTLPGRDVSGAMRWRRWLLTGCSLGLLVLTRIESLVLVVPVFLLWSGSMLRGESARAWMTSLALTTIPVGIGVFVHGGVNWIKFGSLAGAQHFMDHPSLGPATFWLGLAGLLGSPGRGLLVFFPLAALAPLGAARMTRVPGQRGFAWAATGLILGHLVFFAVWPVWWGGVCWGPRFLVPVLPLLALTALFPGASPPSAAAGRVVRRRLVEGMAKAALICAGFASALSGVLLPWDQLEGAHVSKFPPPTTFPDAARPYFHPEANALWAHWTDVSDPARYDVLLRDRERSFGVWAQCAAIAVTGAASLAVAAPRRRRRETRPEKRPRSS